MIIKINESNVQKYVTLIETQKELKFSIKNYFIEKALKNYFDKLIIENLLSNDKIVGFFDKNEFGLTENNTVIYKKDIIDETTFYGTIKNNKGLQNYISNEFQKAFLEVLDDADISFDIENYMIVTCLIEEINYLRIYTVKYQYYRNYIVESFTNKFKKLIKKYMLIGGSILLTILVGIIITIFLKR